MKESAAARVGSRCSHHLTPNTPHAVAGHWCGKIKLGQAFLYMLFALLLVAAAPVLLQAHCPLVWGTSAAKPGREKRADCSRLGVH